MGPNVNTGVFTLDDVIDGRTADRYLTDAAYHQALGNGRRIDDLEKRNIDLAASITHAVHYLLEELRNKPINTIDEDELSESIMALIVGTGGHVT